jgi:hypothetical protein
LAAAFLALTEILSLMFVSLILYEINENAHPISPRGWMAESVEVPCTLVLRQRRVDER